MKINNKLVVIIIFFLMILLSTPVSDAIVNIKTNGLKESVQDSHPPIIIDGNDDFTSENGVTGGSGTEEDPFIIENWTIEGHGSDSDGIYIKNTDVYFIIRNCIINGFYGLSSERRGSGISFFCVNNGRIENVKTSKNVEGIFINKNSENIVIDNCSCGNYSSNYASGIGCSKSQYISIIETICHNSYYGIYLNETSYVDCKMSSINDNDWGVWGIGHTKQSIFNYSFENCEIYNNDRDGMSFYLMYLNPFNRHSGNIHISKCEIFSNGIPLPDHWGDYGIRIEDLHDNIIEDCNIYHNGAGIDLRGSTNNIIRNCSISGHYTEDGAYESGIKIWTNGLTFGYNIIGNHNEITNCDVYKNEIGIGLIRSRTIVHKNNVFNNSIAGIWSAHFDRSSITNNNICDNGKDESSDASVVLQFFCINDLRNNWWNSTEGPKIGRYKDLYFPFSLAFFRPWAKEPISEAGVR